MLTHIHIENFTIVDSLSLDFESGFTVLTGETGAGKSIIVDAVSLALGARADSSCIRQGHGRCDISLCFNLTHIPLAQAWLQDQALDSEEEECIIRRSISRDGKSRSSVNGKPCPQQSIRELAEILISIHSQHQHQALLKPEIQLQQLDAYANHAKHLNSIKTLYQEWQDVNQRLESLKARSRNSEAQLSLLNYQFEELNQLSPISGEWETLFKTHKQLHHRKNLLEHLEQALTHTSEGEVSTSRLLQESLNHVLEIVAIDPKLQSTQTLLETAQIHLQEAVSELEDYQSQLDLSPEHLAEIEERITQYYELSRKHRVSPEDLYDVSEKIMAEINELNNADVEILNLENEINALLNRYQQEAQKLTLSRQKSGKKLSLAITESMQELGMEGGSFKVAFETIQMPISAFGNEKLQFMVCTNPGQSHQPMQKIVSGGELSRISLALQVITAEKENTPTLIFDEVDVGIGGKTAAIVGQLLYELGKKAQVFCITHLPQVAAKGDHHYKVSKETSSQKTVSHIDRLTPEQRREEIARMLGGTLTEQSLAHAAEILG